MLLLLIQECDPIIRILRKQFYPIAQHSIRRDAATHHVVVNHRPRYIKALTQIGNSEILSVIHFSLLYTRKLSCQ